MSEVRALKKTIAYTDTTSVSVGFLPPNAFITRIAVLVTTAFNAGGNDYLDIGDSTTAAKFADDVNIASTGNATVTLLQGGVVQSTSAPTEIKAVYVPAGSSPTAGSAKVVVEYIYNENT